VPLAINNQWRYAFPMTTKLPSQPRDVASAFDAFPKPVRRQLLRVRSLLFETAAKLKGVGPITETLKWGEPAYLTEESGSGSTIRLGWFKTSGAPCAVLFNCKTQLVATIRQQFPDDFVFSKNRAIRFSASEPLPRAALGSCLAMALTYHKRR
jgi:hypothetical protein